MKKTNRILSALLALLMVASLFALLPFSQLFAEGDGENIALGKPARTNKETKTAANINDGKTDTYWLAAWIPLYAEIDLEENYVLSKVVVKQPLKNSNVRGVENAFNVYASVDGVNFDRIGQMDKPAKATEDGFVFNIEADTPYRVVRVMSTMSTRGSSSSTIISELEVYGEKSDAPVVPTANTVEFCSYEDWLYDNYGVDVSKIKDKNGKYDIDDTYTVDDTLAALAGLVTRILGEEYLSWFNFEITGEIESGNDYYEISDDNGKIRIKGNVGVSVAAGLNYYLKYYCKVNVTQETKQVHMPAQIPPVNTVIHTECSVDVRYTYNYCTLSYTMPYYGFEDWQREIDYLMLSGINVILDTTATEALWVLYLQQFGYTLEEAKAFVCGYTWKAWWLMGNLEGYGGPVSNQWIVDTVEMARVNQRYMTVMGADPCLQAFVGTLPTDFAAHAGKILSAMGFEPIIAKMTGTGSWAGFTRPYALNTSFDGFDYLARAFYETQDYIYGRIGDYYAGDFLHEIDGNFNLDPQFNKANMSRTVLDRLIDENKNAVWIIQSWWENPLPEVVEGWGKDRTKHMLLLDLAAAQSPRWSERDPNKYGGLEFGGSSWCYCILENYGGREGLHEKLYTMVKNFSNTLYRAKHLKGIGLTAEGTERSPALFDLFWEMAWYPSIDARVWIADYAERRYGTDDGAEAWRGLLNTVYNFNSYDGTTYNMAITNYPKFGYGPDYNASTGAFGSGYYYPSYNRTAFAEAITQLIGLYDLYKNEETYVYDLVELLTTDLAASANVYLYWAFQAAKIADYETFHTYKTKFLRAIAILDELSAFTKNQLLGNWVGRVDNFINDSRTGSYSDFDIDLMKLDSVILITNWSTIDLGNYANRTYSGLLEDYYYRMWNAFMTAAEVKVAAGEKITSADDRLGVNTGAVCYNMGREVGLAAMLGTKYYSAQPTPVDGDLTHRSLKEVLDEIAAVFFFGAEDVATVALPVENATVRVEGGALTGSVKGTAVADIAAQFTLTNHASLGLLDGETLLTAGEPWQAGMKLVIVEEDGSVYDALGVTVGELTVDPAADAEKETYRAALAPLAQELASDDRSDFTGAAKASLDRYAADLAAALDSGSYTLLKTAFDKREDAAALLENAKADLAARKKALYDEARALHESLVGPFAAREADPAYLIPQKTSALFAGTASVFGGTTENSPLSEIVAFSKAATQEKRAFEALGGVQKRLAAYYEDAPFDIGALIVRFTNGFEG